MATLTRREWFRAAAVVVGLSCSEVRGAGGTTIAVLALPSADTGQANRATRELAQGLNTALQSAGFRVVSLGSDVPVALEELVAAANAEAVDVALGVRSLGESKVCPRLHTPRAVPRPDQSNRTLGQDQLAALVRQLTAAMRYEASDRLASSLKSAARPSKASRATTSSACSLVPRAHWASRRHRSAHRPSPARFRPGAQIRGEACLPAPRA